MDVVVFHQIVDSWVRGDVPVRAIEFTSSAGVAKESWSCPRPLVYLPGATPLYVSG